MLSAASPRAALVRLPHPLTPISLPQRGFGRSGASLAMRAKDSDDARALVSERRAEPPQPKREGFLYGDGLGKEEASKEEEDQAGFSSWNILNQINVELGSDKSYAILIYGTSALAAVWVSSIVVSALDSIPLVPKVMEVVGLGFTVWFTSRYLLFKDNRDELIIRIGSIKQQILGCDND